MLQVQIHEKYLEKRPTTGGNPDYDQVLADFRDNLVGLWGIKPVPKGNYIVADLPDNIASKKFDVVTFLAVMFEDFTKTMTTTVCREGGDVRNWNPFIKLAESAIDTEIPEGLPNSIIAASYDTETDPENPILLSPERKKTWREWIEIGGNYTYDLINGYYYFVSVAGNKGFYLSGSQLKLIYDSPGVTLTTSLPKLPEEEV